MKRDSPPEGTRAGIHGKTGVSDRDPAGRADRERLQGNQCNDRRIPEGPVRIADRAGTIVRQKSTKRPPGILKRYQAAEE